jgi:hypothetical protein
MAAGRKDLTIEVAAEYDFEVTWKTSTAPGAPAVDLSNCTALMHIRPGYYQAGTAPIVVLNSPDEITLGGVAGTITVVMPYSQTWLLRSYKKLKYDMLVTFPTTRPKRLLYGNIKVMPAVTVPDDLVA